MNKLHFVEFPPKSSLFLNTETDSIFPLCVIDLAALPLTESCFYLLCNVVLARVGLNYSSGLEVILRKYCAPRNNSTSYHLLSTRQVHIVFVLTTVMHGI